MQARWVGFELVEQPAVDPFRSWLGRRWPALPWPASRFGMPGQAGPPWRGER